MKKFSEALKDNYATIVGAVLMLLAITIYTISFFSEFDMAWYEAVAMMVVGWIFLMAKDKYFEKLISVFIKK